MPGSYSATRQPRRVRPWQPLLAIVWLAAIFFGGLATLPAFAQQPPAAAQPSQPQQQLDAAQAQRDAIEQELRSPNLADAELQNLRTQAAAVGTIAQNVITDVTPRLAAVKARLDQLGPPPTDAAVKEAQSVTDDRDQQQKIYNDLDAAVKRGRLLSVDAGQTSNEISARRRELFTRALFKSSQSLLSPNLWLEFAGEVPRDFRSLGYVFNGWWSNTAAVLSGWRILACLVLLAGIAAGYVFLTAMGRRVIRHDPDNLNPTRLARAGVALWVAVVTSAVPIAAVLSLFAVLHDFEIFGPSYDSLVEAIIMAVVRVAITLGLVRGFLAPGLPSWRVANLSEKAADQLIKSLLAVAVILSVSQIVEATNDLIAASLTQTVVARGLSSLLVALVLAYAARVVAARPEDDEECLGPRVQAAKRNWLGPLRLAIWTIALATFLAVSLGYVELGGFLVEQTVWVSFVGAMLYLLFILANEGVDAAFTPQSPIGRMLITNVGIRRESLDQAGALITGIADLALFILAGLLVLAPWGIESDDMLGSVRAAYFGFQFGDVTISLSTLLSALLLFGVTIAASRGFQRWLDTSFLPRTHLDTGLRNSIGTSIGYLGFTIAAALALSTLGFGIERLAIIAGALSVGIGFGLQSIVNNFVSGLIILWERAIRVGDWIVVGDEQGYVRRINVRSTEIETFDRATMIVPNSNLITGVVKNWVRNDRVGRVRVPITVNLNADPEKVREILLACAKAQELALKIPAPQVMFTVLGDTSLKFELLCFVSEVEMKGRVTSDIHFEIFKRFKEAGIGTAPPAAPATQVTIHGLEQLDAIVTRLEGGAVPPQRRAG